MKLDLENLFPKPRNALFALSLLAILFGSTGNGSAQNTEPLKGAVTGGFEKPNIILVLTDDQGYGDLGCHGHPFLRTPNIDRLYSQSTRFTDFHVSPSCAPTRSALMSGQYPYHVGVTHTAVQRCKMNVSAVTIADVLKSTGYATGVFGKWHLGDNDPFQPENRGFEEVFIHSGGGIADGQPNSKIKLKNNKVRGYFDPVLKHNGTFVQTEGYCTDIFFQQALGWMKAAIDSRKPFFSYISTNAPHSPFVVDAKYSDPYQEHCLNYFKGTMAENLASYYGMIENIDDNMGVLMEKLDEWGVSDNTVLIFMTDNGSAAAWKIYNAGMKGYKCHNSEGGARVPFIMRWPGKIEAGVDVNRLTRHYDLFPTLAEIAGAAIPENKPLDGRSLMPLMKAPKTDAWEDRLTFIQVSKWPDGQRDEYRHRNIAIRNEKWRLESPFNRPGKEAEGEQRFSLYDIVNDSGQKNDLSEQHPEICREMMEAYDAYWERSLPFMINENTEIDRSNPFSTGYKKQLEEKGISQWVAPVL